MSKDEIEKIECERIDPPRCGMDLLTAPAVVDNKIVCPVCNETASGNGGALYFGQGRDSKVKFFECKNKHKTRISECSWSVR